MPESKKYSLNKSDLLSVGRGLLIACIGAVLTYLTEQIPNIDFGAYTPIVVAAWGVIANIVRKFLTESR